MWLESEEAGLALWLLQKKARGRDLQWVQHVSVVTCEDCQCCFMHYFSQESGIHSQREVYILSLPFLMRITCDLKHCFASYGLNFFDEKGVTKIHFIIKCYIPKARAIRGGLIFHLFWRVCFRNAHTHTGLLTHTYTHILYVFRNTLHRGKVTWPLTTA